MVKWADYLISEVSYRPNHLIKIAKRHKDSESGISQGQFIDRLTIASDIKKGYSYMTVYEGLSSWKKGNKINTFRINGEPFIRVDGNKVSLDNLGDLPEVDQKIQNKINEIKDGQKDIKSKTEPEPEKPLQSPRGSLPKDTGTELPQELDLAPEPINEPEPEEATPEQLARLEQLEKQIQELESEDLQNEIIKKLREQSKKLDQIEKNISFPLSSNKTNSQINSLLAYCVKCKTKRGIENPIPTTTKNGRSALKGKCKNCGTRVFRIIKKEIVI